MLTLADLLAVTGGEALSRGPESFAGVSIDSRTIREGELFFAIKGERHDGHTFLPTVLQQAGGAVIARDFDRASLCHLFQHKSVVAVADPLVAMQLWARLIRLRFMYPVIAVVGSNGKTTTKEFTASVLSVLLSVYKSAGNLNNHIGLPLSLLRKPDTAQIVVVEMGTNRPGDVRELCEIARPDIGIITNIGMEHLEGFGSLERVRDAELELLPYIRTAIVNADDVFLMDGVKSVFRGKIISFGIDNPHADIRGSSLMTTDSGISFILHIGADAAEISLQLAGSFNVANALAAAAAGASLGISIQDIRRGLEAFSGVQMRFSVFLHEGITVLSDVYNANPSSVNAAVDELVRFSRRESDPLRRRMVAVLGDMLELGDREAAYHFDVGSRLKTEGVDLFIGVGTRMRHAVAAFGENAVSAGDASDAVRILRPLLRKGDCMLIKGSRGMRMERVCEGLGIEASKK
ncbi:MAG: UDP-N-acetylmuramoyl-tripeptide--D-alanyl-D-alanine ligase [Nitrospirae bacterium]|nr:MAG: UDP-N-acetylmuramoyl-tripeptide--D-alanyl-D-alanine ligase [Nitrospirota bacterium]